MVKTGVVHGRFQIFHLKHMEYVLAAKMRCQKLLIGVTHPDIVSFAATSGYDQHGVTHRDNPLTYYERYEMIQEALSDFGVKREEYEILPFPISQPDLLFEYVPKDATYYMSICSEWDEVRCQILKDLGVEPEILWRRKPEDKGISGTQIRERIAQGKEWKSLVPKTVAEYITGHGIDTRIQELHYRLDD